MRTLVYLFIAISLLLLAVGTVQAEGRLVTGNNRLLRQPCPAIKCANPCAVCDEQSDRTCVTKETTFKPEGRNRRCPGCPALVSCDVAETETSCTEDAKVCDGGTSVGRDPSNDCQFFPCPTPQGCTKDLKVCDDGTRVARDPYNNCKFSPCPAAQGLSCEKDLKVCDDGSTVSRDPFSFCKFFPCPTVQECGTAVCDEGWVCCNASCGICTKPGGACIQRFCDPAP